MVSFPSFHTTMALILIWAFRGTSLIGWLITGLNLAMLCAVPYFGGHYLVDMIAGAAVMLLSLTVIRSAPAWWKYRGVRATIATASA